MSAVNPKLVQDLFVRISRDSGYNLSATRVAHFAGDMLGITALEVWGYMPSIAVMEKVASGEHAACKAAPVSVQPLEIGD